MKFNDEEYQKEQTIRSIEQKLSRMSLRQLEMLNYELQTKDFSENP